MAENARVEQPTSRRRETRRPVRVASPPAATTVLALRGSIGGAELGPLAIALDRARTDHTRVLTLDLAELVNWSLGAQAILLSAARTLGRDGGALFLAHPTPRLRLQAAQMGVFGRIRTLDTDGRLPDETPVTEVGLVIVEGRRALLVRRNSDPILRLPGGRVSDGDNIRGVLADYIASQLGIDCHEEALLPSTTISDAGPGDPAAQVTLLGFHAPFSAAILERASTRSKVIWATHTSSGVFTATAGNALSRLHSGGHID